MFFQKQATPADGARRVSEVIMGAGEINDFRQKVGQAKNTERITGAMRLVAAAKVRRAQAAVLQSRPFCETLAAILYKLKTKLEFEDIDTPLLKNREVKNVCLVVVSGERGLCGPYHSKVIKMTEARIDELRSQGLEPKLIFVGKKAADYFKKRPVQI